jgi:ABC-type phosphate transport system permease subunit
MFTLHDLNPAHHLIVSWCIGVPLAFLFARFLQRRLLRRYTYYNFMISLLAAVLPPVGLFFCTITCIVAFDDVFRPLDNKLSNEAPKWM